MRTEDEIFSTDEEAFKAIEEYIKQESIAFAKFIHANATSMLMGDKWHFIENELIRYVTTEELYSLYLQNKKQ